MLLTIFNTFGLGKISAYSVVLQMADRTKVVLEGIIEDVLIKVSMFIITIDFIVIDYDACGRVLIKMGCPFLATGGSLINVGEGTLIMRLNNEKAVLKVYKKHNTPSHYKYLCM